MTMAGSATGEIRDDVSRFLGIPYASAPAGSRRWRPPVAPAPWPGGCDCLSFGPDCPQSSIPFFGEKPGRMAEDNCLTLNVWTPADRQSSALPVLVWLHGGGFIAGAAARPWYDGAALARRGAVVVSLNYRLGVLGFLVHPALTAENPEAPANWGLQDQIAALRWVRDNIQAFGGDPGCVTILGQSAGAVSVYALMSSPAAAGLFHRASALSGAPPRELVSLAEAEAFGIQLATRLGVAGTDDLALRALRGCSCAELLAAINEEGAPFLPGDGTRRWLCADGQILPSSPLSVFRAGSQISVPLLAGTVADEGTVFVRRMPEFSLEEWRNLLARRFGGRASEAEMLWLATSPEETRGAYAALLGDGFVAGTRLAVRSQSRIQPRAFLYQFAHRRESRNPAVRDLGCFHGAEVPYVLGAFGRGAAALSEADRRLAERMQDFWLRFACTGDPNDPDLPAWPAWNDASDVHLEMAAGFRTVSGLRRPQCDFLEQTWR